MKAVTVFSLQGALLEKDGAGVMNDEAIVSRDRAASSSKIAVYYVKVMYLEGYWRELIIDCPSPFLWIKKTSQLRHYDN